MKTIFALFLSILFVTVQGQKIIFEGDSNTRGEFIESPGAWTGSILNYPNQTMIQLNNPALAKHSIGVNSSQTTNIIYDMYTRYPGVVDANSVFVLMIGINDFGNLVSAPTVFQNVKAILAYSRSLGCTKFVVATYPPTLRQPVGSTGNTNRLIFNQMVRDSSSFYNYALADVAAVPQFITFDQQYYADNIHWNIAGCGIVASVVKNAIITVLGGTPSATPLGITPKTNATFYWDQSGKVVLSPQALVQSYTGSIPADVSTLSVNPSTLSYATESNAKTTYQSYSAATNVGSQAWEGELGLEFKVNNPQGIVVTQLGAFDHQGNGITGTQGPAQNSVRVAIFNKATQSIVPGLDELITSSADTYMGYHRMKNVAPITLPPGEYMVVAKGYNNSEKNGNCYAAGTQPNPADLNNGNGAISFLKSWYNNPGTGFTFPNYASAASNNAWLAGTFNFTLPQSNNTNTTITKTVTLSVKDIQGNLATTTANVTIVDSTRPTIVPKNITVQLNSSGQASFNPADMIQSVTDNCDTDPAVQVSQLSFSCSDVTGNSSAIGNYQAYSSSNNIGNQSWQGELGMEFKINNPQGIVIKQLGAFDHQGDGIKGSQGPNHNGIRVAIFNKATQAIVPGLDVIITGNADAYTGNHRMKNITPVTLTPGEYMVVAKGYNSAELNGNSFLAGRQANSADLNGGNGLVTFLKSWYNQDNPAGFTMPTYAGTTPGNTWVAGTFTFGQPAGANQAKNVVPVIITATDKSGNVSETTATVTINNANAVCGNTSPCSSDTIAPVIIAKNITVQLDASGHASITPLSVIQSVTDNCDANPTVQLDKTNLSCADISRSSATNTTGNYQAYNASTSTGNQSWQGELGMEFIVNNPNGILVSQLGTFDHQGDGIKANIRVAIFNKATQSIVPGLDVSINGLADTYTGNHRMKNITPVVLPPGTYMVVAKGYNAAEMNGNCFVAGRIPSSIDLNDGNGAISFTKSWYNENKPSGFSMPNYIGTTPGNTWLAGTFDFSVVMGNSQVNNKVSVTIKATDNKGNMSEAIATVTIGNAASVCNTTSPCSNDTVAPTIVAKNITVQLDASGSATISSSDVIQSLSDNCDANPSVQLSKSTFSCSDVTVVPQTTGSYQGYNAGTSAGNQSWQGELGMEFTVNNPKGILVTQLGTFDHQGDGIKGNIRVAIFNKSTQSIVAGLDETINGMADAYTGNHRMKNVTPVILPPGDYMVVAKGYNSSELNGNSFLAGRMPNAADLNTAGGAVSFTKSWYNESKPSGFTMPTFIGTTPGNTWLAGTFKFSVVSGVSQTNNIIPVIISATDSKGNVSQAQATVTITDPLLVCNQPATFTKANSSFSPLSEMQVETTNVKLYPNPTSGPFNVSLVNLPAGKATIQIADQKGRIVEQKTVEATQGLLNIPFNLANKAQGMYIIKVITAEGVKVSKIILQR